MYYQKCIETPLLELIRSLQNKTYLHNFCLVGGTALTLHLGHRKSVDIDLFSNTNFDAAALLENIHQDYPYQLFSTSNNTLRGSINNIKIDILAHRYRYIQQPIVAEGITFLSKPDIIAMKLNAISTSGQRSKDYVDVYYLMEEYSLQDMLDFYRTKYDQQNDAFILKSLIYFDEVDLSDWPILVKNPILKWENVMEKIESVVMQHVKMSGL